MPLRRWTLPTPMCGRTIFIDLFLVLRLLLGIFIYSPPRLAAQPSSFDVLHHQRRWTELLAEALMQIFEDMQTSIQPDQIHHLEWTHRMIQSKLERLVDVVCGS